MAAPRPLSRLESALRRAAHDLDALNSRWALIGGLAVSARVEPRLTRDIDLAVAVTDDAEAERLVRDLQTRQYVVPAIVEQEATGRLASARLLPPDEDAGGVVLDMLFASSGIEPEVVSDAEVLELLPRLRVPVATVGHLIALKILARDDQSRPQDRIDLVGLVAAASAEEIARARAAIALIEQRGFHRHKDLRADLDAFLKGRPGPG